MPHTRPFWAASLLALALALPLAAQEAATDEAAGAAPADAGTAAAEPAAPAEPSEAAETEATPEAGDAAAPADAGTGTGADAATATGEADATAAAPDAASAPAEAPTADTVVATVNGATITLGEAVIAAASLPPQYQGLPPDVLFGAVVDQLVQQELLAQTVAEVPARVDLALANQRRTLLAGEALEAAADDLVTDEAVQALYDETYGSAEPQTEWSASHILVASEEEAQAVIERLNAGEDFAALAGELSTDPGSGAQGGALGFFGPGMMVPEFEAAADALAVGAVSEPIQSQFGWHVIRLDEERPLEPPTLDAVRPEIEAQVRNDAVLARIAALEAEGDVTRLEPGAVDPAAIGDLSILD